MILPTRKQWNQWTLPSKLTAIGAYVGILGLLITLVTILANIMTNKELKDSTAKAYHSFKLSLMDVPIFQEPDELIGCYQLEDKEFDSFFHDRRFDNMPFLLEIEIPNSTMRADGESDYFDEEKDDRICIIMPGVTNDYINRTQIIIEGLSNVDSRPGYGRHDYNRYDHLHIFQIFFHVHFEHSFSGSTTHSLKPFLVDPDRAVATFVKLRNN